MGDSREDQNFLKEHFRNQVGLERHIMSRLARQWKIQWRNELHNVREDLPQLRFEVVESLRAAAMKIDGLKWY